MKFCVQKKNHFILKKCVNIGSVFSSKFLLYIQVITTKVVSSVVVAVVVDSLDTSRTRRDIDMGQSSKSVREQQISFHPCVFYNNSIHPASHIQKKKTKLSRPSPPKTNPPQPNNHQQTFLLQFNSNIMWR